jgi:hypothetical protein
VEFFEDFRFHAQKILLPLIELAAGVIVGIGK